MMTIKTQWSAVRLCLWCQLVEERYTTIRKDWQITKQTSFIGLIVFTHGPQWQLLLYGQWWEMANGDSAGACNAFLRWPIMSSSVVLNVILSKWASDGSKYFQHIWYQATWLASFTFYWVRYTATCQEWWGKCHSSCMAKMMGQDYFMVLCGIQCAVILHQTDIAIIRMLPQNILTSPPQASRWTTSSCRMRKCSSSFTLYLSMHENKLLFLCFSSSIITHSQRPFANAMILPWWHFDWENDIVVEFLGMKLGDYTLSRMTTYCLLVICNTCINRD